MERRPGAAVVVSPQLSLIALRSMKRSEESNATAGQLEDVYRPPPRPRRSAADKKLPRVDARRLSVLALALVLVIGGGLGKWYEGDESVPFASAAMIRIGLVLGALWLAWPSLRRPARWLPPGAAVTGVIALAVVAAQPRLIFVAIPAVGALISLAAIVRAVRRGSR